MKNRLIGLTLALLVAVAAPVMAQTKKIPVYVDTTTKSRLGATLAYTLREQLRASQTYEIVLKKTDALFVINMVALDTQDNVTVAASVALCIDNDSGYDYFLDHWIITAGSERITSITTDLIASIDGDVQTILKKLAAK